MRRRDIWVDFNDVDESGMARTLERFAEPGVHVSLGAQLLAGDDEGNLCKGRVIDITDKGIVELELELDTFDPETCEDLIDSSAR